ncbi:MAG: tetratricopeptide repeat protein [Helicobacteraceae bacterium]|nr:tetratricopeptide repeat protein [Helicobacteraceae bacterium]
MDKNFVNALQKLATEQGKDVLLDVEKTKTLLSNYIQNEYQKERKLLLTAIETGAAKEIVNASDLVACKKAQIRKLEENFTDESAAADIIDVLAFILRGDSSKSIAAQSAQKNTTGRKIKIALIIILQIFTCLLSGGKIYYAKTIAPEIQEVNKLFEEALSAARHGDYQDAIDLYSELIPINGEAHWFKTLIINLYSRAPNPPNNSIAYYNRGIAYIKLRNYDQAVKDYTQAIALDPKDDQAYHNRGGAYCKLGNYDQAIADFTKAIELNPKYASAYFNRGVTYDKQQNYNQAITDFTKAIELAPKDATYYNNRGNVYYELQNYDQAISDYTKAIELDPKFVMAYSNRGVAYKKLQNYDQAIKDCTQAIKIDPKYASAYNNRGITYYDLKNYDQAIADYTKAIELEPENAIYYNNRGEAYNDLKNYDQARIDAKKACDLGNCELWNQLNK